MEINLDLNVTEKATFKLTQDVRIDVSVENNILKITPKINKRALEEVEDELFVEKLFGKPKENIKGDFCEIMSKADEHIKKMDKEHKVDSLVKMGKIGYLSIPHSRCYYKHIKEGKEVSE